jgi:transcriptional regulator with XRE-family HTH domain
MRQTSPKEPHAQAPEPPRKVFARRLKEERLAQNWTQENLVDVLATYGIKKLHQTSITSLEKGKRKPTLDELCAIAAAFQVSLDSLLIDHMTWQDHLVQRAERSAEEVDRDAQIALQRIDDPPTKGVVMRGSTVEAAKRGRLRESENQAADLREQIRQVMENIEVQEACIEDVADEEPLRANEERLYMERLRGRLEVLQELSS